MIDAEESLLEHDGLSLKLDRLQEVSELELDASDVGNAARNLFVHGTRNLEKHVNGLRV